MHRFEHALFVFDIALLATSLLSNLGMIYFICGQKKARTTHNITIVSMAVADMLMASIVVPMDLAMFLFRSAEDGVTPFLCKMNRYIAFWSKTVIIYSTLGMVVNRYFRITDPRSQAFVAGRCMFYLNFVWFSGAAYNIWKVMLNTSKIVNISSRDRVETNATVKWCTTSDYFRYLHISSISSDFVVIFFIPFVFISILFSKMLFFLWQSYGTQETSTTKCRIVMAVLYTFMFYACQLPLEIVGALYSTRTSLSEETLGLFRFFETLSYMQSVFNVVVYVTCSRELHKSWRQAICGEGNRALTGRQQAPRSHVLLRTRSYENVPETIGMS